MKIELFIGNFCRTNVALIIKYYYTNFEFNTIYFHYDQVNVSL